MTYIKRVTLGGLALVLGCLFYVTACDQQPVDGGGEDYDLFGGLEQIESSARVTITKGETVGRNALFQFEIENIDSEYIIPGIYDGWCIEWTKPIADQGDVHGDLQIYSTYGQNRFRPLNYFLNIMDDLQEEDPELTWREFQAVIWSIVEGPEFNLDRIADEDLPRDLMSNGEPNFDREKVRKIIAKVYADASSFQYGQGKILALFIKTGKDEQDVMVPVDPEEQTVSHGFVEGVTPSDDPEFEERTYPVIQADWEGPGGDKLWLGWNLGATDAPTSIDDDHPDRVGWYFQFNRLQGYFHDGTPDENVDGFPAESFDEDSDWLIENDPCRKLLDESWRVPTLAEWEAVLDANAETNLNIHRRTGRIDATGTFRTGGGFHWSSTQDPESHFAALSFVRFDIEPQTRIQDGNKEDGSTIRCIKG